MTVPTTTRLREHDGDGAETVFSFAFKVFIAADLIVTLIVDSTEVETVQTLGVDYTISGLNVPSGGNVTMVVAPASGETLRIERTPEFKQRTDLRNQGTYLPSNVEDALDNIVMMILALAGGAIDVSGIDDEAIHENVDGEINAIDSKATPVDADVTIIEDSADGFAKKKILLTRLLAIATGSNQGTDGEGVYDTKVGDDLQFRNVAPASSMVTISLNGKDIDIDVDAAEILEDIFSGTGLLVRTGAGTYTVRTIIGGTNVTVDDGDGVSGNPTINASGGGGDGWDNTIYTDTGPDNRPTANAANLGHAYRVQNPGGWMRQETIYRKKDGSTYERHIDWTSHD